MTVKYTNWYRTSSMEREAGFQDLVNKLGFGLTTALVMVMLGSTAFNAAQHARVTPEEVQEAFNNPTAVEQARTIIENLDQEQVQPEAEQHLAEPSDALIQNLIRLEGTREYQTHIGHYRNNRFYPYNDTRNVPTVGYGHRILPNENFQNGINDQEAIQMLQQDAQLAVDGANRLVQNYNITADAHQIVTEMVFQMGERGVQGFRNMLVALSNQDYDAAANEILDSEFARDDAPTRANELANRMRNN